MKITKANAFLMQVQLTEPFEISMGTVYDYSGTILEFETGSETGYGEESTIPKITGEVPAAVYETVLQILGSRLQRGQLCSSVCYRSCSL